nr:TRIC cation channel family protein [uncultured Pseudogulbenkiania sp.]
MNEHLLFTLLDIAGTFVFALSGAVAAKQRNLDLFGIITVAFTVACGGGWSGMCPSGPYRRLACPTGII